MDRTSGLKQLALRGCHTLVGFLFGATAVVRLLLLLDTLLREVQVGETKTITVALHSSGVAVLEGTVRSDEQNQRAERAAWSSRVVTGVINHLRIGK